MLDDKLREVGHDAEAEHAPAEREQHVCSRLCAGRGAPLRGGERLGPDAVGRVQGQSAFRADPIGRDRRPAEGRALGELRGEGGSGESCVVIMYPASREGLTSLYPTELDRRAMVDSANFYTMSILY